MGAMQNEFVNLGDHHQAPDLVLEEWISEEFEDLDDAANDDFDDEGYVENDADIRLSLGKDKYDNTPMQVSIIGTTSPSPSQRMVPVTIVSGRGTSHTPAFVTTPKFDCLNRSSSAGPNPRR